MNTSTSNGFELRPLHNVCFFELSLAVKVLNEKKIHLLYRLCGRSYDGVFSMRAGSHPRLKSFLAPKAHCEGWSDFLNTAPAKITFDSNRANKIQSVIHKDYEFEADLGDLQPLTQVLK